MLGLGFGLDLEHLENGEARGRIDDEDPPAYREIWVRFRVRVRVRGDMGYREDAPARAAHEGQAPRHSGRRGEGCATW